MRAALVTLAVVLLAAAPAHGADGRWLAGDLHVHTCASHDVFCGEPDEAAEPWTLGLPVHARFGEAAARGLDFLAITDHNDTSSARDPGFGAAGVVGVPGYEASLDGHAQVLGTDRVLDAGDRSSAAVNALAGELRAAGGVLQANHVGERQTEPFAGCGSSTGLDWSYGTQVELDAVEVVNPTAPARTAEAFLDCLLRAGQTPAITGGSDAHWAATAAVQGVGHPTTWVHAAEATPAAILAALRDGRTSVSKAPPVQGGAPLLVEHDADRDGTWELAIGARVAPGTPLRVRSASPVAAGLVTVTGAAGALVTDAPLAPGGAVRLTAPPSGWARATLLAAPGTAAASAPGCEPAGQPLATCAYDHALLALASPVFVAT